MDFNYKKDIVPCATPECKETFLKTGPRHIYCKHCQVDRQKERSKAFAKNGKKSKLIL